MRMQCLAGVAQRIRASDYGSEGWGFESLRPHHETLEILGFFQMAFDGKLVEDSNGIATGFRIAFHCQPGNLSKSAD